MRRTAPTTVSCCPAHTPVPERDRREKPPNGVSGRPESDTRIEKNLIAAVRVMMPPMSDQKPTLEYGKAVSRYWVWRMAMALSIVIGLAVAAMSFCCLIALGGYGPINEWILRLAYDDNLVLLLPPLALAGAAAGMIGWGKNQSMVAVIGIVWSVIALVGSLAVSAIDYVVHFYKT